MEINPERSGREPGEEALPRTEIAPSAHDVARALIYMEDPAAIRTFTGGTRIEWEAYGKFSIHVYDPAAPPPIRERSFHADFEAEHFHYGELPGVFQGRSGLRQFIDPVGARRRREQEARNRLPIPDRVAEVLAEYLR
ncbi:MAG: hypothetical protein WD926_00170 [Patescibacteria group bacterium]